MKTIYLLLPILLLLFKPTVGKSQLSQDEQIIKLAELLKQYGRTEEWKGLKKGLSLISDTELIATKDFIETSLNNRRLLLEKSMLMVKDSQDLRNIFSVLELAPYLMRSDSLRNKAMVKQVRTRPVRQVELLVNYYSHLFKSVIHPFKDYDIKNQRFFFDDLQLNSQQQRGIFFLIAMTNYSSLIYRYLHASDPPELETAYSWVKAFPTLC